ncbi:hypothetical protein [Candidatus Enterococcus ferrettii]|uniref:Uncharacterized protein n=1 Tax=Candidatus Enterococcus ferrettii TaxID=2815324 RepID=A0ABV0EJH4_9ENTE|nr:hypothetical protein [Enterococcus sp. 665A]MBO1338450.1 hypothetical protein [Enterococcus sp. 665A]
MKWIKRVSAGLLIALTTSILLYIVSFILICPAINDARAKKFEKSYASIALPPETERIETYSFCGNTTGTGNHVEIWAGVLVKSELSVPEINRWFETAALPEPAYERLVWSVAEDLSANCPAMNSLIKFSQLEQLEKAEGYYILGSFHDAATQHDSRGH